MCVNRFYLRLLFWMIHFVNIGNTKSACNETDYTNDKNYTAVEGVIVDETLFSKYASLKTANLIRRIFNTFHPGIDRKHIKVIESIENTTKNVEFSFKEEGACVLSCAGKTTKVVINASHIQNLTMPVVIVAETVQITTEDPEHNRTRVAVAIFSRKCNTSLDKKFIKLTSITVPVTLKFDLKCDIDSKYNDIIDKIERYCIALRENNNWTREGCKTLKENSTHVECWCNETGIFTVFSEIERRPLSYPLVLLYFVGGCLSACFLLATISILLKFKNHLQKERVYPQINLALSFFLYYCSNAVRASVNLMNPIPHGSCILAALFGEFFLLSSIYAILFEGIILGIKMLPFSLTGILKTRYLTGLLMLSWFIPLILSAIMIPICITQDNCMLQSLFYKDLNEKIKDERTNEDDDEIHLILSRYKKYDLCWPNPEVGAVLVKTISVGLVFAVNSFILLAVSIIVCRARNADRTRFSDRPTNFYEYIMNALQAILILHAALGIPWLLVYFIVLNFTRVEATIYLYSVVNSLQGFIVFLVYCVLNRDLRSVVRRKLEARNANSTSRKWILELIPTNARGQTNH